MTANPQARPVLRKAVALIAVAVARPLHARCAWLIYGLKAPSGAVVPLNPSELPRACHREFE